MRQGVHTDEPAHSMASPIGNASHRHGNHSCDVALLYLQSCSTPTTALQVYRLQHSGLESNSRPKPRKLLKRYKQLRQLLTEGWPVEPELDLTPGGKRTSAAAASAGDASDAASSSSGSGSDAYEVFEDEAVEDFDQFGYADVSGVGDFANRRDSYAADEDEDTVTQQADTMAALIEDGTVRAPQGSRLHHQVDEMLTGLMSGKLDLPEGERGLEPEARGEQMQQQLQEQQRAAKEAAEVELAEQRAAAEARRPEPPAARAARLQRERTASARCAVCRSPRTCHRCWEYMNGARHFRMHLHSQQFRTIGLTTLQHAYALASMLAEIAAHLCVLCRKAAQRRAEEAQAAEQAAAERQERLRQSRFHAAQAAYAQLRRPQHPASAPAQPAQQLWAETETSARKQPTTSAEAPSSARSSAEHDVPRLRTDADEGGATGGATGRHKVRRKTKRKVRKQAEERAASTEADVDSSAAKETGSDEGEMASSSAAAERPFRTFLVQTPRRTELSEEASSSIKEAAPASAARRKRKSIQAQEAQADASERPIPDTCVADCDTHAEQACLADFACKVIVLHLLQDSTRSDTVTGSLFNACLSPVPPCSSHGRLAAHRTASSVRAGSDGQRCRRQKRAGRRPPRRLARKSCGGLSHRAGRHRSRAHRRAPQRAQA